ncbi:MAG: LicD family protein [Eubacterium sp.]|nr:LicD family protein [Eubacterium sp.]
MIELDDITLRSLQLTELELLAEVHRICTKCAIHYNIIAGTLLGAVRHGGFIPWDDDADVALLRLEYERFRKACRTELDHARFYFQDQRNTPGYRWGYGKLRRKNTLFLRECQEHMPYPQGVFIDIFPLDYVPENYTLRRIHNLKCFLYRKFFWAEAGRKADPSPVMRLLYHMMAKVPERKLKKGFYRFIQKSNQKKSGWVRILTFPTPNRAYGYRADWYLHSVDIFFEDIKLRGIRDYEAYLTFKFGNYKELPPESERKTHPVSRIRVLEGMQKYETDKVISKF